MNSEQNEILQRLQKICDYLEIEGILCPECTKALRDNIYKINQKDITLHSACINNLLASFDGYLGIVLMNYLE